MAGLMQFEKESQFINRYQETQPVKESSPPRYIPEDHIGGLLQQDKSGASPFKEHDDQKRLQEQAHWKSPAKPRAQVAPPQPIIEDLDEEGDLPAPKRSSVPSSMKSGAGKKSNKNSKVSSKMSDRGITTPQRKYSDIKTTMMSAPKGGVKRAAINLGDASYQS